MDSHFWEQNWERERKRVVVFFFLLLCDDETVSHTDDEFHFSGSPQQQQQQQPEIRFDDVRRSHWSAVRPSFAAASAVVVAVCVCDSCFQDDDDAMRVVVLFLLLYYSVINYWVAAAKERRKYELLLYYSPSCVDVAMDDNTDTNNKKGTNHRIPARLFPSFVVCLLSRFSMESIQQRQQQIELRMPRLMWEDYHSKAELQTHLSQISLAAAAAAAAQLERGEPNTK